MAENNDKIKYLVADTTAFINAVPLNEYADKVLTVPDVIAEVRNTRQIRRLCVLPYDLLVREPRAESVKHCTEFSKKTGDYASLSGIDLKVIALTYELETETMGADHLRTEPVMSETVDSKICAQDETKNVLLGWYTPDSNDDEFGAESTADDIDPDQELLPKLFDNLTCVVAPEEKETPSDLIGLNEQAERCDEQVREKGASKGNKQYNEEVNNEEVDNEEVDNEGWITPNNIATAKKLLEGKMEKELLPAVACITTDYALQNVLKQLNLNLVALNGRIIKELRTYILRCYACFKTTSIMTKLFCPNCGNKTLKRVAVSLDNDGKQIMYINARRPLTAKYKNQSIPRFHGGKHSHNPILFEDQPMPRQMSSKLAKSRTNVMDESYFVGFSPFVTRDIDSKSAMLRSKGHLKEWMHNTNYEEDRRRKNCKRLYK